MVNARSKSDIGHGVHAKASIHAKSSHSHAKLDEHEHEHEPPKIPDVELIVDGFGFMPKRIKLHHDSAKNVFDKAAKDDLSSEEEEAEEEEESDALGGASTSNINIVRRYTWRTKNRMIVQVITYGATITSIQVPNKKGVPDDIVAGFDTLEEYFNPRNPYFGSTIGRYANIICDASMQLRPSGKIYLLSTNKGQHHFHGGYIGFDKVNWRSYVTGNKVIMSHVSSRFHEGYPGTVMAQISFEATCDNTLKIEMRCTATEPTIINLSNSPYFNLAGHHAGKDSMYDHIFTINADKYTVMDDSGYVTGEKKLVGGTALDFRVPRILKVMLPKIPLGGYDMNYCITQGTEQDVTFHARVLHPMTGRVLEVYSNQPGLQFYTGNLLPDPDRIVEVTTKTKGEEENLSNESSSVSSAEDEGEEEMSENEEVLSEGKVSFGYVPLVGKYGAHYKKHGLFCLMPQNYPDAINHRNFPNSILNPGEVYLHRIQYKFGILLGNYI